jgi:outer membrane receptor protein involved in Fe transport
MRSSLLGCLLLPSVLTSNAIAQRATARDSAQRDSAQSLPGVTIAATRSPASILTTPLAVTRLSAPELRSLGGFGLDEALSRVPGVIAQSRYGTSDIRLMIRGFGARGAGDRSNSGTNCAFLNGQNQPYTLLILDNLQIGGVKTVSPGGQDLTIGGNPAYYVNLAGDQLYVEKGPKTLFITALGQSGIEEQLTAMANVAIPRV